MTAVNGQGVKHARVKIVVFGKGEHVSMLRALLRRLKHQRKSLHLMTAVNGQRVTNAIVKIAAYGVIEHVSMLPAQGNVKH